MLGPLVADEDPGRPERRGELGGEPFEPGGGRARPGAADRGPDRVDPACRDHGAALAERGLVTPSPEKATSVSVPWPNWRCEPLMAFEATTAFDRV